MIKVFSIVINIDNNVCDFTVLSILTDSIIYPNLPFNFITTKIYCIEITKQNCYNLFVLFVICQKHSHHKLIYYLVITYGLYCLKVKNKIRI